MFNHTVRYLAGTPGIWAWAILNEPWYWPHKLNPPFDSIDQKENFVDLIQKLSNIVKTLDGRPVTIRFVDTHEDIEADGEPALRNIFVGDWNWDQRILNALDFISFNAYKPAALELETTWQNMTAANVASCVNYSEKVWITEFGSNSSDDTVQSEVIRGYVDFFKTLPIDGYMAWCWQHGVSTNSSDVMDRFNLYNSTEDTPRPAYYAMLGNP
jgi:hypothetical protein